MLAEILFHTLAEIYFQPMKKSPYFLTILLFTILLLAGGCKGRTPASGTADKRDSVASKDELIKEVFEYPLPTAFEVTNMLVNAKAPCIIDLCNPITSAEKYISQTRKAINLGVYGADLCYTVAYNQSQETMNYMNVTRKLADELNIGSSFNSSVVEHIEANLQNKDSLIRIISDAFYQTYNNLMQNKQDKISALVMAGSWIEAFYITSQIYLTARNKDAIASILIAHGNSLNKLLEIMQPFSDENDVAFIYNDLLSIEKEYARLEKEKKTIKDFSSLVQFAEKIRAQITV